MNRNVKRAIAREWLWLLGCMGVALIAAAGMRIVGRFVIPATYDRTLGRSMDDRLFTVETDDAGYLVAVTGRWRLPLKKTNSGAYQIGGVESLPPNDGLHQGYDYIWRSSGQISLREPSSPTYYDSRGGTLYQTVPGGKAIGFAPDTDDPRSGSFSPASTDWSTIGIAAAVIWVLLYAAAAFIRITSWAIRMRTAREPTAPQDTNAAN